jgi:hypothetical protein
LYAILYGAEESGLAGTIVGAADSDGFVLIERSAGHAGPWPRQVWNAGRAAEMQDGTVEDAPRSWWMIDHSDSRRHG